MTSQKMMVWFGWVALNLSWVTAASGIPIPVNNPSFETPVLAGENAMQAPPLPGWEVDGTGDYYIRIWNPPSDRFAYWEPGGITPQGAQGTNVLFLWPKAELGDYVAARQELPSTFQAGCYTLTVAIGATSGYVAPENNEILIMQGETVLGSTNVTRYQVPEGYFIDKSVAVVIPSDSPYLGLPISIMLKSSRGTTGGTRYVCFDNVRLDFISEDDPSVLDFELPVLDENRTQPLPFMGWEVDGTGTYDASIWNPPANRFAYWEPGDVTPQGAQGTNVLFFWPAAELGDYVAARRELPSTFQAGCYTLTVAIGATSGYVAPENNEILIMQGETVLGSTNVTRYQVPEGYFIDKSVAVVIPSDSPYLGLPISIMLKSSRGTTGGTRYVCFDNVRLDFIPEDTNYGSVIFESDFTGIQDEYLSSLPEWSDCAVMPGTSRTVDDGMGMLYGRVVGWGYTSIRADAGQDAACNFNPFTASGTGNRFEHTIVGVESDDPERPLHMIWVGPQALATSSAFSVVGERLCCRLMRNMTTGLLELSLRIINSTTTATNTGIVALTLSTADLVAGDQIRIALQIRDNGGNDVRIAYRKYTGGTWGDWTNSGWINPTDSAYGTNAFAPDWKTRWANNTFYYIETNFRKYDTTTYPGTIWIDDVTVMGDVVEKAPTPVFSPDVTYVTNDTPIAIDCETTSAEIHYTLDGSEPTKSSPLYEGPVSVDPGQTLSARAWVADLAPSPIKSVTYKAFNNPIYIPRADGSVTVDGDLSEWSPGEFVALDKDYSGASPLPSAAYAVRWDGTTNQFYVAVKVNDPTHVFADMYESWNTQDGVEIYVHTTGGAPYNYEDMQDTAQQYVIGLKTPAARTQNARDNVWKTFAGNRVISGELAEEIGFQAAGVEEVDEFGSPTGWLFYEVRMTAYEWLVTTGSIVSPLTAGDLVGVDVIVCDRYASGFGMKSENLLTEKYKNWRQIGIHKLVMDRGDFNGDGAIDAADIDALQAAVRAGSTDLAYDLDGSGTVTSADVDYLVNTLLGTVYGDANLDGVCTFEDFAALQNHYGQSGGWADGDFNGDGHVTFADFSILQNNYGQSIQTGSAAAALAEDDGFRAAMPCVPVGVMLLAGLFLAVLGLTAVDPMFASTTFGSPDFLYLSSSTPAAVRQGDGEGTYMGARPVAGTGIPPADPRADAIAETGGCVGTHRLGANG